MYKFFQLMGVTGILASGATAGGLLTNQKGPIQHTKNTNLQVKAWPGPHFPGMGPYGSVHNQDYAKEWTSSGVLVDNFKIDISVDSFNYIFDHYIKSKGDSVGYAIYDFLTDVYPSGDFTNWLYKEVKSKADEIFGDLATKVELTSSHTVPFQNIGGYIDIKVTNYLIASGYSWSYGYQ